MHEKRKWIFQYWVFRSKFTPNSNGKWPLNIWFYKWGIGYHWRDIADAHIEIIK